MSDSDSGYKSKQRALKLRGPVGAVVSVVKQAVGLFDRPDPARVWGIDTSHWTGVVDWDRAFEMGCRFAIVKFLDGINVTRFAEENYKGLVDNGKILIGSYQWLRHHDEVSPGQQARRYLDFLRSHPVQLPPAVDFEWSPAGKKLNCKVDDLYRQLMPFEQGYGAMEMIYTADGYWEQYGSRSAFLASRASWQARYGGPPLLMLPWQNTKIHQWTEKLDGVWMGIPKDGEQGADGNYWLGTLQELYAWCHVPFDASKFPGGQ